MKTKQLVRISITAFAVSCFAPLPSAKATSTDQVAIYGATANLTTHLLNVSGANFGSTTPTVKLDNTSLTVVSSSTTTIQAALPTSITPGSYLLTVSTGTGATFNAIFDVAAFNDSSGGTEDRGNGNSAAENVQALNPATTGINNTAHGWFSLQNNTDGNENTADGYQALNQNGSGGANTAVGTGALYSNTNGNYNTATGDAAMWHNVSGSENTGIGFRALNTNFFGDDNTAIGADAMFRNTTGARNTATGAWSLEENTTGDDNTAVGDHALFLNTTGIQNTAVGSAALRSNTTGTPNTALGYQALFSNDVGFFNTGLGYQALFSNTSGMRNCAAGNAALTSNTTGTDNTAIGNATLINNDSGSFNTALSRRALSRNTGSFNIGLGFWAGSNLTSGDNNIYISNLGVAAEANTIRIGNQVAAADFLGEAVHPAHTATFIAGIYGATTSDAGSTTPVVIDMNGNLGTAASSERFKHDVKPMDKSSDALLELKPVTFHYKADAKNTPQFGLVAEDVAKVNPDLVVRDNNGQIYTVRYDAVNAMLLNEFLKAHRRIEEQDKRIDELTAQLKQQAALIQKVSDQVELNKPAPQVVNNDR